MTRWRGQGIPYLRVDHDPANTIAVCQEVERVLGSKICKNLFLCNRQQTQFYLLLMPGDKPFQTKHLSAQLGCSRLSFAGEEQLQRLLQTTPGSVSPLELLFETQGLVQLVIDRPLLADEFISGHPGISTSTLQLARADMLRFLSATGHEAVYVDLPDAREE